MNLVQYHSHSASVSESDLVLNLSLGIWPGFLYGDYWFVTGLWFFGLWSNSYRWNLFWVIPLCYNIHINSNKNTSIKYNSSLINGSLWGGADRSLAWPGRKQATATKLRIYSTYSPQSSVHFLALSLTFACYSKKILEGCLPNQVSAAAMTSVLNEKWRPFNCFFSTGNRW